MSDLEFFLVLLAAFYLWECTCWIPRGGVAFVSWWSRYCRPAPLVGNPLGGFALAQPLPPLGHILVAGALPVSVSPAGLLSYVATTVPPGGRPPQTCQFVRWKDVKSVEARRRSLLINRALFAQTLSTVHARWLADELRRLAALSDADRPDEIVRFVRSGFDTVRLQERLDDLNARTRNLRTLANAMLVTLFAIAPAAVWRFGILSTWPYVLSGVFILCAAIAVLFLRSHRAVHPTAGDERFAQFLMILLFPPAAIRASDMISRPLVESFHPLTVASVVGDPARLADYCRPILLDFSHPALPLQTAHDPQLTEVESWSRSTALAAARNVLSVRGLDPDEVIRPPAPADASCRGYCPRCHAQFTKADARCADCGGMPVVPFATDSNSSAA